MDLRHYRSHQLRLVGLVCILSLGAGFGSAAQADMTLVIQQTAATLGPNSSEQPAPVPQKFTLRYKDGNARVDLADKRVLLYGKDGIIHTLNLSQKTYTTNFVSEIQAANDPLPPGAEVPLEEKTKLELRRTNMTQTIMGMKAHQYHLTGTVLLTRTDPNVLLVQGVQTGSEGLAHSVSLKQDDDTDHKKKGEKKLPLPAGPEIKLDGDLWLSDNVKVPGMDSTLILAQLIAPTSGPLLKPLADTLNGRKALLLQANVTVTCTPLPPLDTTSPLPPVTTETTLTLQSYTTSTLTDTLFQTPPDYNLTGGSPTLFLLGSPTK